MREQLLFAVAPYAAVVLLLAGLAARVRSSAEPAPPEPGSRVLRWGFWGVALGHLVGFLMPEKILLWNSAPWRLLLLETTGFALGALALFGLVRTFVRRAGVSIADSVFWTLLAAEVASGLAIAVLYRWGSSWYAAVLAPYLWSLVRFQPEAGLLAPMPFLVRFHVFAAFALLAFLPWSRPGLRLVSPLTRRRLQAPSREGFQSA